MSQGSLKELKNIQKLQKMKYWTAEQLQEEAIHEYEKLQTQKQLKQKKKK